MQMIVQKLLDLWLENFEIKNFPDLDRKWPECSNLQYWDRL